ncbi:MAG: GNAT family N-acetyltransferase [Flavobacteriales bacterium]|nr:GNAT family N-acetyltransferase [Flavobacteriales bacterium]
MNEGIEKLTWDSLFFGFNVGKIEFKNYVDSVSADEYKLIYVFNDEESHIKIRNFSKTYEEHKVVFYKKLRLNSIQRDENIEDVKNIKNTSFVSEDLYNLAFESGKYSRFKLDSKFTKQQFEELYKIWIDNSLDGKYAEALYVYIIKNKIEGFISYIIKNKVAQVGLFAVSNKMQGKGIGGKLLSNLETEVFKKGGVDYIEIPTQLENKLACKFYKSKGYEVKSVTKINHFWQNETPSESGGN